MTRHAWPSLVLLTASVFLAACSGETTNTSEDEVAEDEVSTPPSQEAKPAEGWTSTPYTAGESNDRPAGRTRTGSGERIPPRAE